MQMAFALLSNGFTALTGGGAAAATGAAATGAAAAGAAATGAAATGAAVGGGFSLSSLLEGTATLFGAFASMEAANAEPDMYEAKAIDAEAEIPLETLQGIQRRASIKKDLMASIGEQDAAYAASSVDLSFGTPSVAKKEAFRQADLALTSDGGTQETRQNRLDERARSYRRAARRARSAGFFDALGPVLSFGANLFKRG